MDVVPPPLPGSRIQELGDSLIVRFRPTRSWAMLTFVAIWLTGWTVGGIAAASQLWAADDWGDRAFLLVWLCAWVFGECTAIILVAWQLFGREVFTVTPHKLELRQEIGRFARAKRYEAILVHGVRAALVPSGEGEKSRRDFSVEISYDDETVLVGEGMGEREAEYVVGAVLAQIRTPTRWSNVQSAEWWGSNARQHGHASDDDRDEGAAQIAGSAVQEPRRRRRWARAIFPVFVIVCLAGLLLSNSGDPPQQRRDEPRRQTSGFPSAQDFSDPRTYAEATTLFALGSATMKVIEPPTCGTRVTWTAWTCSARGRTTIGPFAGRTLIYSCSPTSAEQTGGLPMSQGILCGPRVR